MGCTATVSVTAGTAIRTAMVGAATGSVTEGTATCSVTSWTATSSVMAWTTMSSVADTGHNRIQYLQSILALDQGAQMIGHPDVQPTGHGLRKSHLVRDWSRIGWADAPGFAFGKLPGRRTRPSSASRSPASAGDKPGLTRNPRICSGHPIERRSMLQEVSMPPGPPTPALLHHYLASAQRVGDRQHQALGQMGAIYASHVSLTYGPTYSLASSSGL